MRTVGCCLVEGTGDDDVAAMTTPPPGFDLAHLKNGDDGAWNQAVRALGGPLRAFLRFRGAVDVEDALGEVFLDVARNIDRFEGDWTSFRTWVFTIARRRVIDEHRYRNRRPIDPIDPETLIGAVAIGGNTEVDAMERLGTGWVMDLLDLLTPIQREVLMLRFVLGLSIREVAAVTGASATAVKANQRRAKEKLGRELERRTQSFRARRSAVERIG